METDYSEKCEKARAEVRQHILTHEFDSSVIVTYNSVEQRLNNFWQMEGHPDTYTPADIKYMAWQMAAKSADSLKDESDNLKDRQINISPKKKIVFSNTWHDRMPVLQVGLLISPLKNRLWLHFEISTAQVGIAVSWYEGINKENGVGYWTASLLLGIFIFRLSQDKNVSP